MGAVNRPADKKTPHQDKRPKAALAFKRMELVACNADAVIVHRI